MRPCVLAAVAFAAFVWALGLVVVAVWISHRITVLCNVNPATWLVLLLSARCTAGTADQLLRSFHATGCNHGVVQGSHGVSAVCAVRFGG